MGMKFLRTRLENLIWCLLFTVSFSDHHFGLCDDSNSVLYKWFFLLIHLIFSNCSLPSPLLVVVSLSIFSYIIIKSGWGYSFSINDLLSKYEVVYN